MTNISYFLVSLMLVWILMTGYLGYLHLKLLRLYEIMERSENGDD